MLKAILILVSVVTTIVALLKLGKKKKHFQIFPDSTKKELFKEARMVTILNIISVVFIFASAFVFYSSFFYILIIMSLLLAFNSIINIEENLTDFHDKN